MTRLQLQSALNRLCGLGQLLHMGETFFIVCTTEITTVFTSQDFKWNEACEVRIPGAQELGAAIVFGSYTVTF